MGETGDNKDIEGKDDNDPTTLECAQHAQDYTKYVQKNQCADAPDFINPEEELSSKTIAKGMYMLETKPKTKKPEPSLHKTTSVIIRGLPSGVHHEEIADLCIRIHGAFMRIHMTEPNPEKAFMRDAICSFWANANIEKIAWRLRQTRLRNMQLDVEIYNKIQKRIKTVDGISADKAIVLRDIQLAKSLIEYLDKRFGLWQAPADTGVEEGEHFTGRVSAKIAPFIIK